MAQSYSSGHGGNGQPGETIKDRMGDTMNMHGRAAQYAEWLDVVPVPSKA